jgi:hypothetical protein
MINEPVAGQRGTTECAAPDENVVRSVVCAFGIYATRQRSGHGRAHAGSAQNVKIRTRLAECLPYIGAEVGTSECSTAAGNEANCPTGQKTAEAKNVCCVLKSDVMVHEDLARSKPEGRARHHFGTSFVKDNETPR